MKKSPVQLHAHPPERHRRQAVTLPCGCCCCCCCLHTVGGLIGAAVGSAAAAPTRPQGPPDDTLVDRYGRPLFFKRPDPGISAVGLYWLTLVVLMALVFLLGWVRDIGRGGMEEVPLWGLWMLILFLPGVQLVASVIAMFLAAVTDWNDAAARVWAVAKITLGTVIGTAIGAGLLFLFCVGLGGL